MRVFLAGAGGVVGKRLVPLLLRAGHSVIGSTRKADRAAVLAAQGIEPTIVDFMDAGASAAAVSAARPDVVIHQLTDLPQSLDAVPRDEMLRRNADLRIVGTENLVRATVAAGVRRMIAQSVAFAYAPGPTPHREDEPIDPGSRGVVMLERFVLGTPGLDGTVLRYGYFYGPGTWYMAPERAPAIHVDAAAHAALLALDGAPGIYNLSEDEEIVTSAKARQLLGWDPAFRMADNSPK
jgi:nucleoside-diphosphate-sugar epimerase